MPRFWLLLRRQFHLLREYMVTPAWLRFLPAPLRARVENRPNLQKALTNIGWLFGDKVLRMGVGLFVGLWVARYLGPEQFGLLNYAMAIVALVGVVASLGLNSIVVRDLVTDADAANETLGTAFFLQAVGGLASFGVAVLVINFARPDDGLAKLLVAVLAFVMVFKCTDVVRYWFESQVQSKYIVWLENGVFIALATVKVALVLVEAPLIAFVWAAFTEGVLAALGLLGVYAWRGGTLSNWRVSFKRAGDLLKDSWPLILSGLGVMVYMRIDQIMLGQMLGDEAVGMYSAAVRISEVWYFIPTAIIASVFPAVALAKKTSEELYYERMQKLYDVIAVMSLGVAIIMTFCSTWIVTLLYGAAYVDAAPILAIHVWAGVFTFLGVASSQWFLLENMVVSMFYRTALGAVVNIALNLLLIPKYGAQGAAFATLVSYSVAAFWFDALGRKSRRLFLMKLRAIFLINIYVRQKNTSPNHP